MHHFHWVEMPIQYVQIPNFIMSFITHTQKMLCFFIILLSFFIYVGETLSAMIMRDIPFGTEPFTAIDLTGFQLTWPKVPSELFSSLGVHCP